MKSVVGTVFLALVPATAPMDRHAGMPPRLTLRDAPPEVAARELQQLLGTPVEIRGGTGQRLNLDLPLTAGDRMVGQVASALGGTWKLRLRVRVGKPAEVPPGAPDRILSLGVQDRPASRALESVARELRAELDAPPGLTRRVSVLAVNVPVETVLDQISEQAGVTWTLTYLIDAPASRPAPPARAEPVPRLPAAPPSEIPAPPVVAPVTAPRPVTEASQAALSGAGLKTAIQAVLREMMQAPASSRSAAVREAVQRLDRLALPLSQLSPTDRAARIASVAGVLNQWRRIVGGVAPRVAQELAPVTEALERRFR